MAAIQSQDEKAAAAKRPTVTGVSSSTSPVKPVALSASLDTSNTKVEIDKWVVNFQSFQLLILHNLSLNTVGI